MMECALGLRMQAQGQTVYAPWPDNPQSRVPESPRIIHVEHGRDLDNRLRLHLKDHAQDHAKYGRMYQQTREEVSGGEKITTDLPAPAQDNPDAQN